jgi:hypothetical protein
MRFVRENGRYIAAVFLLLLIFGLSSLWYTFGRDQGIHAQVGAAWLDGQLPYRDVWHTKGFLSFVPHSLVTAVFGPTMWGIRLFDLIWQFGTGLLIFLIGRQRMTSWGAVLAAGLYYVVYYAFGYWHMAQPDGFLSPVVLLGVWLYERGRKANRPGLLLLLSGAVIALAPWFKQTAVVFVAALVVWAIYDSWKGREWSRAGLIVGGVILTNGVMVGFTAVSGMFSPMLEAYNYTFFDYSAIGREGVFEILRLTVLWGIWYPVLIFPFLAGAGYLFYNRDFWFEWVGICLMAVAGLASIYIQGRLWIYHWVPSLPFMVLIGAFSLVRSVTFLASLTEKKQQGIIWLFGFLCLSLALPMLNRHLRNTVVVLSYITGRTSEDAYLERYDLLDVVETADYLASNTEEDEPIFIWGHFAIIYYLADRSNPTRFINDPPLGLEHGRLAAFRQEAAEDLANDPPAYIVVATDDATGLEPDTSREQLTEFTALAGFLASRYELETTIGDFEIYRAADN